MMIYYLEKKPNVLPQLSEISVNSELKKLLSMFLCAPQCLVQFMGPLLFLLLRALGIFLNSANSPSRSVLYLSVSCRAFEVPFLGRSICIILYIIKIFVFLHMCNVKLNLLYGSGKQHKNFNISFFTGRETFRLYSYTPEAI